MTKEILLFVGPSGAGKDAVADRMTLLTGANVLSLSNKVRKEAKKAGLKEPSRRDLQLFANSMREVHGQDVFAKLTQQEVEETSDPIVIINGVRHPEEIKAFNCPTIIGVDASKETRFQRVIERGRQSDPKTWDDFLECDERENGTLTGLVGQQNYQCLSHSNVTIWNEGSLEGLEYTVDMLVDQFLRLGHLDGVTRLDPSKLENPEVKKLIVANGPHSSGKTTVGRNIAQLIGIPFQDEIGGELRKEVSFNALTSSITFDREVMRRELLRDHSLRRDKNSDSFIVETWHIGNLAYILQRSPELAVPYLSVLKEQLLRFETAYLLFLISDNNFLARIRENVAPDQRETLLQFYKGITAFTRDLYARFNLKHIETQNDGDIDQAFKLTLSFAQTHLESQIVKETL